MANQPANTALHFGQFGDFSEGFQGGFAPQPGGQQSFGPGGPQQPQVRKLTCLLEACYTAAHPFLRAWQALVGTALGNAGFLHNTTCRAMGYSQTFDTSACGLASVLQCTTSTEHGSAPAALASDAQGPGAAAGLGKGLPAAPWRATAHSRYGRGLGRAVCLAMCWKASEGACTAIIRKVP